LSIRTTGAVAFSALFLALWSGCGGTEVSGTTWLIIAGEDTLTVSQLGEAWNSMAPRKQELFREKDNTVGEFIVAYGRRVVLEDELWNAGYMEDEEIISMGDNWLRQKVLENTRNHMHQGYLDSVSDELIDERMDMVGITVFFSTDPGGENEASHGPIGLIGLPDMVIELMISMEPGDVATAMDGTVFRLDSTGVADSSITAQALADTAALRSQIASGIAKRMYDEGLEQLRLDIVNDYSVVIDSTAMLQFQTGYMEEGDFPDPSIVVIDSDLGVWTAEEIKAGVDEMAPSITVDPTDLNWLYQYLDFQLLASYAEVYLDDNCPGVMDSLRNETELFMLEHASEIFYDDRIAEDVEITEEYMRDIFNNMEEPLMIPEKRVLQIANLHEDSVVVYRHLPPEERDEFLQRMPGFPNLAADSANPQISRPLAIDEVPGFHGEEVFMIDPADTSTWLGPLELYGGVRRIAFRLVDVIPEREAEFDEVRDQLQTMARNRLEEQATVNLMQELEAEYGMVINEEILESLPQDPSTWSQL